jgi:hypothetical protein
MVYGLDEKAGLNPYIDTAGNIIENEKAKILKTYSIWITHRYGARWR